MTNQPQGAAERPTPSPASPSALRFAPAGFSSWWSRLSPGARAAALIVSGVLPVVLCSGGLTALGAITGDSEAPTTDAAGVGPVAETAAPEVRTVVETEEIPFAEETVEDPSLPEGTRKVRTKGAVGTRESVYRVTFVDGVEVDRELVSEEVTEEPVVQVVAVGTGEKRERESKPKREKASEPKPEPEPECHPNYEGACVPIASDVDCAGGSGNGPAYVRGPVRVVGPDVYDLDRDGDGIACDR